MNRLSLLLAIAGAVAVVTAVSALILPGVLAQPQERDERPGRIELREVTVAPGTVTGDSATLVVDAYLNHEGETTPNVSVVYRAIDGESGFQQTVERTDLGDVSRDGETVVTKNVTVERSGSYRLEVLVYRDGRRIAAGGKQISGLDALTPPYARTTVQFHQFDREDVPTIEYAIAGTDGNRTTLDTSIYLTNGGSTTTEGLRVEVTARQAESNIVADRETLRLDRVEPGETVTPSASLTVPSGYNYYLDAVLWKDDVIVGTTRSAANLDPTRRISVNQTVEDVGLEVSDFEGATEPDTDRPEPTQPEPQETDAQSPGFGVGVALVSLLVGSLLLRRAHDE